MGLVTKPGPATKILLSASLASLHSPASPDPGAWAHPLCQGLAALSWGPGSRPLGTEEGWTGVRAEGGWWCGGQPRCTDVTS